MLRAIIVSPDQELGERLEDRLIGAGQVAIARRLDRYPTTIEVVRFIRAHAPQIVFLSIENLDSAFAVVSAIEANSPGVQVVAIHRVCDPRILLELMRAGIREFLALPFDVQPLQETLARVEDLIQKKPPSIPVTDLVFSFLPSKAGVGTSTIALNVAYALSRQPDMQVLLSDFDLNSGMMRFMMKLDNPYSVIDACQNAFQMDDQLWPKMVSSSGHLDIMHAGHLSPEARIEPPQIRHLLEFARRNYRAICVDLSGNLEKYSLEIMHECKQIFLVCTPEISSLHLAREKYMYLKTLDLAGRVGVLLNRAQKRSVISPAQVEELLGVSVLTTFQNDYQAVQKALSAGRHVEPGSELGKQFSNLAKSIVEPQKSVPAEPKKRLIEYFSLLPARYNIVPETKKPA